MEEAVLQRIKELIEYKNLSVLAFSRMLNVDQSTLNKQLRGDSRLSILTIFRVISLMPEISAEWLLRGEGTMLKGSNGIVISSDSSVNQTGIVNTNTNSTQDSSDYIKHLEEEIVFLRSLLKK